MFIFKPLGASLPTLTRKPGKKEAKSEVKNADKMLAKMMGTPKEADQLYAFVFP